MLIGSYESHSLSTYVAEEILMKQLCRQTNWKRTIVCMYIMYDEEIFHLLQMFCGCM